MKGERLQSLSDMYTKPFPSHSFISFPRDREKKGKTVRKKKRVKTEKHREERAESKTIMLWILSPIKEEKKNLHLLALLGGLRRADALQWSMGLTVEDITMSLIETFLQGLLWGSCSVKSPSNASSSSLRTFVPGCGCYGGSWLAFTSPVSLLRHTHITLNKETTNNAEQFSASCTFK